MKFTGWRVFALVLVAFSYLAACEQRESPSDANVALLAAIVAYEDAEVQLAMLRGDTAAAKKTLDLAIERSLAQVVLVLESNGSDSDLGRQGRRAAVMVGTYWTKSPPEFSVTPPVAEFIRDVCNAENACGDSVAP